MTDNEKHEDSTSLNKINHINVQNPNTIHKMLIVSKYLLSHPIRTDRSTFYVQFKFYLSSKIPNIIQLFGSKGTTFISYNNIL